MKKVLLILMCCMAIQSVHAQDTPKWADKAKKAVFSIVTYDKENKIKNTGNGFYIDNNGTALSDYSLFEDAERAVIINADGKELPVTRIAGANSMYDVIKFRTETEKKITALKVFLLHLYSSHIYSNILLFIAIFYYILSFTGDIVQIKATQTICSTYIQLMEEFIMNRDLKKIISQMTLEEKAGMCSGLDFWHLKSVERLGIPEVMVSDGPHGLRKQDDKGDHLGMNDSIKAVCFPPAALSACSFDRNLMESMGETIGREAQANDVSVVLGPAVNIKRFSALRKKLRILFRDPYLAGEIAAAFINGVQSQHVGTSIKHFAANNQGISPHEQFF